MNKSSFVVKTAFLGDKNVLRGNTKVKVIESTNTTALLLHGNCIAQKQVGENKFIIRNCGWFSNITKERLNALPNVRIYQKNFTWYLNDEIWDGTDKEIIF